MFLWEWERGKVGMDGLECGYTKGWLKKFTVPNYVTGTQWHLLVNKTC